jgi:hypothetical protein
MTIATFFLLLGLAALLLFLYSARRNRSPENLEHLTSRIRPVDVDAFLNLTDESEEEYLRNLLPAPQFRKIQRERTFAAIEYVRVAGKNASILIQLAEAARRNADPEIAAAGQKLLDSALRLCLYALATVPRLYFTMLFPRAIGSRQVAESYGSLVRQMVMLGCLRYPTHDIASAL